MVSFPPGKIPLDFLQKLLKKIPLKGERIIVGPKVGEDVAVIDFPDRYLLLKVDPITLTGEKMGWYLVNINANDIVTSGGKPLWFLTCVLLPPQGDHSSILENLLKEIISACQNLGITLCGGHTEVTPELPFPVLVGAMVGEVDKDKLITTGGAERGDKIILTKGIAIEGTSIIAREKEEMLKGKVEDRVLERAKEFLYSPGISVVKEALLAVECGGVHSMHDPTEGGLFTGLYEISQASGKGLQVEERKIRVYPETEKISSFFSINPYGLLASGSLLLTASSPQAERIVKNLREEGIPAEIIGEVIDPPPRVILITRDKERREISPFLQDELLKIYKNL